MSTRLARIAFVLLLPVALLSTGCKKKAPAATAPPPQPVEVRLQVTSMSPNTLLPATEASAKIYGSAFEDGATVQFVGPTTVAASGVSVDSANTISLTVPALPAGSYDVKVGNPNGESSTLRGGLAVQVARDCSKVTVNFDFDQSRVRADARSTLDELMACFQASAGRIRVEGHCDERGTLDYNSFLGNRRAESVKSYLVANGVASGRVNTVSYGEERPVDRGHSEVAWSRNRRAEISVVE
ncbi:MAG: OmpA family protein [Myxococcales bacterium]|nr:OmpA family protein [Myxococcales bacterium]